MRKLFIIVGLLIFILLMGMVPVQATYPTSDFGDHPNHIYYINGYTTNGVFDYYYGTAENRTSGSKEGLLVIKNTASDTLFRTMLFDEGYRESFRFLMFFNNETIGIVAMKFGINPQTITYELQYTEVLQYDLYGNYIARLGFEEAMTTCSSHGNLLILSKDTTYGPDYVIDETLSLVELVDEVEATGSFQYPYFGQATINGESVDAIDLREPGIYEIIITQWRYLYTFHVTLHPDLLGLTEGGNYTGSVSIIAKGTLSIDDEPYLSGMIYDTVGYHVLTIEGLNGYVQHTAFTVHPFVRGVSDGGTYTGGVYIQVVGAILSLNDTPYTSNSLIARPGEYTLTIQGSNAYQEDIHFVINPSVTNLSEGDVVTSPFILNFIGEAVLNGNPVEPGTSLTEAGDYILQLMVDDVVFATIHFQVIAETNPSKWGSLKIPYLELGLGILSLIGLFIIIRKK